jgi:hypothetical protein
MHELTPFTRFILILGVITFVLLIAASVGGIGWLIMRSVDKELQKRAADKAKKLRTVDRIDKRV